MLRFIKVLAIVVALLGIVGLVYGARRIIVPSFTSVDGDHMYQWHRVDNEAEWKNFTVKYRGMEYCKDCHMEQYDKVSESKHRMVQCENCHGPAIEHPADPMKLIVDRTRELCHKCHAKLPYRPAEYSELPEGTIPLKMHYPDEHNRDIECGTCHDVHAANFN